MIKRYASQPTQPVTYRTIAPASAPIPTFDNLPPLPPVSDAPTEETIIDPVNQAKKDKIIAELDQIQQRMLESGRIGRTNALREWGEILSTLAELDQHIADMHEIRKAILDGLSESAHHIAKTEWCLHNGAAYQLQGSGILQKHELTRLTDYTDVNEEIYDINKEYM